MNEGNNTVLIQNLTFKIHNSQNIPVVKIFAFLERGQNWTFFKGLACRTYSMPAVKSKKEKMNAAKIAALVFILHSECWCLRKKSDPSNVSFRPHGEILSFQEVTK